MGEVKQENSPKSQFHKPQKDGLQETELLAQRGLPAPVGNQIISRIGNTPSPLAHADMLNRAPQSNKQLLLQLQRQYGNSYVQQVVQQARQQHSPKIQAKLTIGEPGDKYEQEADRVAQQVVRQINAPAPVPSGQSEAVQRQIPGEKDEDDLQMKPIVQRQAEGGMEAAPDVEAAINQARGGGQPLASNIREPMEVAFGADFSGVKVHTDGRSDQLNRSIQARAFTTRQDVFFRQGEYQPGSREGQELIAHELTHVAQQKVGAVQRMPKTRDSTRFQTLSRDAPANYQRGRTRADKKFQQQIEQLSQGQEETVAEGKRNLARYPFRKSLDDTLLFDGRKRPGWPLGFEDYFWNQQKQRQDGGRTLYECVTKDGMKYLPRDGSGDRATIGHKTQWRDYILEKADPGDYEVEGGYIRAYSMDVVLQWYTDVANLQPEGQSYNSQTSAKSYNTDPLVQEWIE